MLIVLPFCNKDALTQLKNVRWMHELDGKTTFECMLAWPEGTRPDHVEQLKAAASKVFACVHEFNYVEATETTWPAGANWAWQQVAKWIPMITDYKGNWSPFKKVLKEGTPWLFLEADAVPLKPGWMKTLADEYVRGGKPFMGHIVKNMGHMNGVAVYPNHVAMLARDAFHAVHSAWDVMLKEQTIELTHNANHLIQHCWVLINHDTPSHNGDGPIASFRDVGHMHRILEPEAVLFHRTKDGTLIDCLMQARSTPVTLPQGKTHTQREGGHQPTDASSGPTESKPYLATAVKGVESGAAAPPVVETHSGEQPEGALVSPAGAPSIHPDDLDVPPRTKVVVLEQPQAEEAPKIPRTEIFIVTYFLDAEWLRHCLYSIKKFATGFAGVTVVFPDRDFDELSAVCLGAEIDHLTIEMFTEAEGKGMIHHMAVEMLADEYTRSDFILHMDSDCLFIEPVTPLDYFVEGKPVLLMEQYSRFAERYPTILQWKTTSEKALNFPCPFETMRRHPAVHHRSLYSRVRQRIEEVHKKPFLEYVLSCKPDFPQGISEFNVLGAYARQEMLDQYHWIDCAKEIRPREKIWQGWSHGGFDRPSDTGQFIPDTPRQVFKKVLGI